LADDPSTLAAQLAALVARGVLHPFDPAYDVALSAIDRGYDGLTTAQKRLYDRIVAPALEGLSKPAGKASGEDRLAWKPIREVPADTAIVQLAVRVDGAMSLMAIPCRRNGATWVGAVTGKAVHVRPTHWREWPRET
jgi:hypothetical protein